MSHSKTLYWILLICYEFELVVSCKEVIFIYKKRVSAIPLRKMIENTKLQLKKLLEKENLYNVWAI